MFTVEIGENSKNFKKKKKNQLKSHHSVNAIHPPHTHTHTMHCIILCINWTYQHTSYLQGLLRLPRAISVLFTLTSDNHTRSPTSSATLPRSSMSVREAQPWTEWIKAGSQSPNKQLTGPLESPDRGHTRFFRTPLDKGSIGSDRSAVSNCTGANYTGHLLLNCFCCHWKYLTKPRSPPESLY